MASEITTRTKAVLTLLNELYEQGYITGLNNNKPLWIAAYGVAIERIINEGVHVYNNNLVEDEYNNLVNLGITNGDVKEEVDDW